MSIDIEAAIASGDPSLIDQALTAMTEGGQQDAPNAEPIAAETQQQQAVTTEPTGDTAPPPSATDETEISGVIARDGKNFLPFSVVSGLREMNKKHEGTIQQLSQRIAELEGSKSGDSDSDPFAELEEFSPELSKKLQAIAAKAEQAASAEEILMRIELAQAKAATPELAKWEQNDPERYARAVEIDTALMHSPDYANRTMAQRFADVVQIVNAERGEAISANQTQQATSSVQARAQQIVEQRAAQASGLPNSLTEVGAMHSNAQRSQIDILAEKHPDAIVAEMQRMTPAQIEQLLSGLV